MNSLLPKPPQDALTVRHLRRGIAYVAIALPFVVAIGNMLFARRFTLPGSISGTYYTDMRDVFVGSLCAIGVFLICYRYDKVDDRLSTVAGILAIGVALFRTTPNRQTTTVTTTDTVIGWVHLVCAVALFLALACFCFFLFTRSDPAQRTSRKRVRNGIYYACGGIILAAIALAAASTALPGSLYDTLKPLFWCEAIAVVAFGTAWLVKGEKIFSDAAAAADVPVGAGVGTPRWHALRPRRLMSPRIRRRQPTPVGDATVSEISDPQP